MADEKPYWVELDTGCLACGRGREYSVIGPDDVALGKTFEEEADAAEYAENLTAAYEAGRASAKDGNADAD